MFAPCPPSTFILRVKMPNTFSEAMMSSNLRKTLECTDAELAEIVPDIAKLEPINCTADLERAIECVEWWQIEHAESWLCSAIEQHGHSTMKCYALGIFYPRIKLILLHDLNGAARAGYVDIVRWLMRTQDAGRKLSDVFSQCILHDHVECADLIYPNIDMSNIPQYKTTAILAASIKCLRYLHARCPTWDSAVLEHAFTDDNNIECIKFAFANGAVMHKNSLENAIIHKPFAHECAVIAIKDPTFELTTRMSEIAAQADNVLILNTFISTGGTTPHCLEYAAAAGSINCLNLLLDTPEVRNTQWIDHSLLQITLHSNSTECMEKIWPLFPDHHSIYPELCQESHILGLKFAHTHGCELTQAHLRMACNYNSFPSIQYIYDHGIRLDCVQTTENLYSWIRDSRVHESTGLLNRIACDQFRLKHNLI